MTSMIEFIPKKKKDIILIKKKKNLFYITIKS
jgi:hypothetical protein